MSLFAELKRRNVIRVAGLYLVGAWLIVQVSSTVLPMFGAPDWLPRTVVILLALGFVPALIVAWVFELTPQGLRRDDEVKPDESIAPQTARRPLSAIHGLRGTWTPVRRMDRTIIVVLIIALVYFAFDKFVLAPRRDTTITANVQKQDAAAGDAKPLDAPGDRSIAVLPFENLSADKDNEYFASGMQDMILTKLSEIGELKVISRTSTEKYKSHPDNLKTIARELGVAKIVEGSVQKAGSKVLINVQLIDVATDRHLWAQAYTRTLDDIFGVEGEVATMIADALRARLTPPQTQAVASVPTRNPQAYDDFLRGQHYLYESGRAASAVAWASAIAAFEKAVVEDPGFALAWASLSSARTQGRFSGADRSEDNLSAAEESAKRALALAPDLPEAHLAMASVHRFSHHDLKGARDEAQRALQLRPNYPDAYVELGIFESHLGNWDAAINAHDRAAVLDPGNSITAYARGVGRVFIGDYTVARQAFERALAINPKFADVYARLSQIALLQSGDIDGASKVLDSMAPDTPPSPSVEAQRIKLLLYRREFAAARTLAAALSEKLGDVRAANTAMLRGDVEWLAGGHDAARAFYLVAVDLLHKPASDLSATNHADLAVAQARLGHPDEANRESNEAIMLSRRADDRSSELQALPELARMKLALGQPAAAIDLLAQVLGERGTGYISPALLRVDPTWDPIRADPRFQALLKDHAERDSAGRGEP